MIYNTAKNANNRNIEPTTQCRVQKHAPAARKITVAIIDSNCIRARHCMRNCTAVIL